MLKQVVRSIGSMGVDLLHKTVMHMVHRWNIKAGIKNRGAVDIGHVHWSKARETRRMAAKLNMEHTIPNLELPPEDFKPGEKMGAMWSPDMKPGDNEELLVVSEGQDSGFEMELDRALTDVFGLLVEKDGRVENVLAQARRDPGASMPEATPGRAPSPRAAGDRQERRPCTCCVLVVWC